MNGILKNLFELQAIEFGEHVDKTTETKAAHLRANIPKSILEHYERLRARGRKGIALVRNQVCTGCHMGVPIGMISTLMRGTNIQLCGNCGRYLYLPAPAENEVPVAVLAAKSAKKTHKVKAYAPAA